ncbi:MAG: enoyl-CoA hydratase/isomerase family protein [Anaerolineales bacterium]|nr:enoyl-CoA hydratase/isomerase family protein [Anaerolineales bacterium]
MTDANLLISKSEGIATITINRPEVRNAMDPETWQLMRRALEDAEQDDAVQVLIITGAGDNAFVAGADVRWLQERSMLATLDATIQKTLSILEGMWKPSIAAINGFAIGGGCELAIACDIRIASERAKLGQPEVRLGILPGGGGTQRLPRLVGVARAKELILTGDLIDAAEAERIGLVNRVVPHEVLMETAVEMAVKIMRRGPLAVRMAKASINAGIDYGPGAGFEFERLAQTILFATEDRIEGTAAFLEKRHPEFKGR